MSNPFPKGLRYAPVPRAVIEQCGDMTEGEYKLIGALYLFAEKHTAVELHLPAYILQDFTKLHHETMARARVSLEKDKGLILCSKGANGVTVYKLLDPETHRPLPAPVHGKQKFRGIYVYKAEGRSARTSRKARKAPATGAGEEVPPVSFEEMGSQNPRTETQPVLAKPERTFRVLRNHVSQNPKPPLLQTHENANTYVQPKKLSEETSRKEVLEKGFASSESSPFPQPERIIPVPKPEAIPIPEVKEESEPVTVRMMREPVIQRLVEKFGARIATTPDANADIVGLPYNEWMKREVDKQLGPGLPYWPKKQIYKQQ